MIIARLYTAMGRGRNGLLEQSLKKTKNKAASNKSNTIMAYGLKTNGPIRRITPNELKFAEQLSPQQLVDLLLGEGSGK